MRNRSVGRSQMGLKVTATVIVSVCLGSAAALQGAVYAKWIKPIIITGTINEESQPMLNRVNEDREARLAGCVETDNIRCA